MSKYKYKTRGIKAHKNSLVGIRKDSGARKQAKIDIINDYDCSAVYFNQEHLIRRYTAIPPIIIFTDKL